jgi:hypothetical protein
VVEAGVSFNAGVTGLLYHRGEIVILAVTAPEPSARLYRYNLAGGRLGSVDLSARPASRLLAAGDGLVLLTPAEDTLEMHWLDAAGSELSETRVPLDLEASSSSTIAAATNGDRLAVLYLVPSGARITPHGTMHVATFRLDGSPVDNAVVLSGPYIAEPRAMVATPEGWAATWVIIDESGPRHVYLTEVGRDSPASFQTSRLGSFLQGLQGGFPSVPLSAGPEGDLVMAWLDTRDTWDADDLLVLHRRSAAGLVQETTYAVAPRSFHALDLATDGDQTSVLVTTTAANGGEYAVEVRHFQGVDAGAIESYSLPGVRVRYRQIESLPAGYALAGEEAKVGDGATIKLLLRPCRE